MKNTSLILFFIISFLAVKNDSLNAQCNGVDSLTYGFNNPNGTGGYSGFLCSGFDSLGTTGINGYYNGDSYVIKLVAGSQVVFSADSCNGNPVSLTINDSANQVIPGAYAAPACPNSLNFTPTYTGVYKVVFNENGICNVFGHNLLGEAYVQIEPGTSVPACPDANLVNDTICGAIALELDSPFVHGNTVLASPTDPLDGYIVALGDSCSPPNNTLWYSFTSPVNIDTVTVWLTSDAGSGFHSWLIGFITNNVANSCSGNLSFLGCVNGPDDNVGIDTVSVSIYGIIAGKVYYLMIDGFNGSTGGFSVAVRSAPLANTTGQLSDLRDFSIFPNPATNELTIEMYRSGAEDAVVSILSSSGQEVFLKKINNLHNQSIDISGLAPGLYLVKVSSPAGILRKKLIINGTK